jgi:predicted DNA-binding protein
MLELSDSASEKLDFYKRKIGIRKAAIINGLIEKYIESYCDDLMRKINNTNV